LFPYTTLLRSHQAGRNDLEPARPRRGAAAPGRDVPREAIDLALAARDRAKIWRPRPHHRDPRGQKNRGTDRDRFDAGRGCRAAAADAAELARRGLRPAFAAPPNEAVRRRFHAILRSRLRPLALTFRGGRAATPSIPQTSVQPP